MRLVGPELPPFEAAPAEVTVRAMTLPEDVSILLIIGLAVAAIVGLAWWLRGMRGAQQRDTAHVIAAVQAERDTLRARHAVEVAELETKIVQLQERIQADLELGLRVKELEKQATETQDELKIRAEELAKERDALAARVSDADATVDKLKRQLDDQTTRAGDVPRLLSERDRARTEVAELGDQISDLKRELQEAIARASRATVDGAEHREQMADLELERDRAISTADRAEMKITTLEDEVRDLTNRLTKMTASSGRAGELANEIEQLNTRIEQDRATIAERDGVIAELQKALDPSSRTDAEREIDRLNRDLERAQQRTDEANEQLSKLAYDWDGLRGRLDNAERSEREARNEVEKREALLELRLQKMADMEHRVRHQHGELHAALRRAETAEELVAAMRSGEPVDEAAVVRDAQIRQQLDEVREQNRQLLQDAERLREELAEANIMAGNGNSAEAAQLEDELRKARAEITKLRDDNRRMSAVDPAAPTKIAALEQENEKLRQTMAAKSEVDAATVAELRAELRAMAAKFAAGGESAADEPAELSLADRIRAYKAARKADSRAGTES